MNVKKYSEEETLQKKIWWAVIYPDATNYDCMQVIDNLQKKFPQYAIAFHNHDVFTADDTDDESKIGLPKKDHFHILWIDDKTISRGRSANILGIPSNYIKTVDNKTKALQYLFHKNNPEKYQYNPNEVVTNIPDFVKRYNKDEDGNMKAQKITTYIFNCETFLSLTQLTKWCIDNYCWDELRRGQHIFTALINEHNQLFSKEI